MTSSIIVVIGIQFLPLSYLLHFQSISITSIPASNKEKSFHPVIFKTLWTSNLKNLSSRTHLWFFLKANIIRLPMCANFWSLLWRTCSVSYFALSISYVEERIICFSCTMCDVDFQYFQFLFVGKQNHCYWSMSSGKYSGNKRKKRQYCEAIIISWQFSFYLYQSGLFLSLKFQLPINLN